MVTVTKARIVTRCWWYVRVMKTCEFSRMFWRDTIMEIRKFLGGLVEDWGWRREKKRVNKKGAIQMSQAPLDYPSFYKEVPKYTSRGYLITRPQINFRTLFTIYFQIRRNALSIWFRMQTKPNPKWTNSPNAMKPFGRTYTQEAPKTFTQRTPQLFIYLFKYPNTLTNCITI